MSPQIENLDLSVLTRLGFEGSVSKDGEKITTKVTENTGIM